jgi:phosphonatase-like hydrolase
MRSALRLVVFDLAGTTVRVDGQQIARAFETALAAHGVTVTPEQISAVRGASKREAIARLLGGGPEQQSRANDAYAMFRADLGRACRDGHVEAMGGSVALFQELRARGVRVALNTGFDRELTDTLLASLGWSNGIVDAVVCADDVRSGRPAPYLIFRAIEATGVTAVREVANVGDTVLDLQAGFNAGVGWNIGVLSGAHDRGRLEQAPHTHIVESVADLRTTFD